MSRVRLSGFTLIELVVYCGLLSIFTAVFVFSLPSRDNKTLENLSFSAEQSGLVLSQMAREFSNSSSARTTLLDTNKGVGFPTAIDDTHPIYTYDASSNLIWRDWVAYYLKGTSLSRYEASLEKAVAIDAVPAFPGLSAMSKGRVGLLCPDVDEFKVELSKSMYLVTLTVSVDGERIRNVSAMAPRN